MLLRTNFRFDSLLHSKVVIKCIMVLMSNCNEPPCWYLENDKIHKNQQLGVLMSNTGALLEGGCPFCAGISVIELFFLLKVPGHGQSGDLYKVAPLRNCA